MPTSRSQNPFQAKAQAMISGFENFPIPNTQLLIRREELTPQQLVQRFQDMVRTLQAVADADAQYKAALRTCEHALPAYHVFYDATVVALRAHFGSNHAMLARFGIRAPKHHRGQPEVEVIVTRPEVEVVEVVDEATSPTEPDAEPPLEVVGQGPEREPRHPPEVPARRREPRARPPSQRRGSGRRPNLRRARPRRDSRR